MYILEVIPLIHLPPQVPQILSYFFGEKLVVGALVEIVVGYRKVQAVVISCDSLEKQKGNIKKSAFQLKKISSVTSTEPKISEYQLRIAHWLAREYFAPAGQCLRTALPDFFEKCNPAVTLANSTSTRGNP